MSEFKKGDRVRVEFEGDVQGAVHSGRFAVHGASSTAYAEADELTLIRKPVRVGDTVTSVQQLDALPADSVVVAEGHLAAQKNGDAWRTSARGDIAVSTIASFWNAHVVYIPDAD